MFIYIYIYIYIYISIKNNKEQNQHKNNLKMTSNLFSMSQFTHKQFKITGNNYYLFQVSELNCLLVKNVRWPTGGEQKITTDCVSLFLFSRSRSLYLSLSLFPVGLHSLLMFNFNTLHFAAFTTPLSLAHYFIVFTCVCVCVCVSAFLIILP